MTHAPPLNYASARRRWVPRWVKRSAAMLALLGIVATAWHFGPQAWRLAQIWYWQRQCMNFNPPAGTVAYESLPPGSALPVVGPPYVGSDDPAVKALRGPVMQNMAKMRGPLPVEAIRVPMCWLRFMQASGKNMWSSEPKVSILFCHERTSPAGHVRLVVIQSPYDDIGEILADSMPVYTYSPVNWHGTVVASSQRAAYFRGLALVSPDRFFAGRPDPKDASHFTIEYQWPNGVRNIIDGFLHDDDTVDLSIRPNPGNIASEEKRVFGR